MGGGRPSYFINLIPQVFFSSCEHEQSKCTCQKRVKMREQNVVRLAAVMTGSVIEV